MNDTLDSEELVRLALDGINGDRHAEAVSLLKTLIEREPKHVFGNYLLAAEHAQLGMWERAEEGYRRTVELDPNFPMARLQYGQILLVKGDAAAAKATFAPLTTLPVNEALGGYARGLTAAADERIGEAIREIQAGLGCPQEIPALEQDMQRVLTSLIAMRDGQSGASAPPRNAEAPAGAAPSLFLTGYSKPRE